MEDFKNRSLRGFTLVELLVVMAIMSVLIGISVAGLGYAMRRSRNINRQAAAANLDRALEAFYSDHQQYPDTTPGATAFPVAADTFMETLIDAPVVGSEDTTGYLYEYLEGSWDVAPKTWIYYKSDSIRYTTCVSQEMGGGDTDCFCLGPAVGYNDAMYAPTEQVEACTTALMGVCGYSNDDSGNLIDCAADPVEP